MGRTKFSSANAFKGKRKRKYTRSAVIISHEQEATKVSAPVARPDSEAEEQTFSTCRKKMSYLGLEINPEDILGKKEKTDSSCQEDNIFFLGQIKSMNRLLSDLVCPKCKLQGLNFNLLASKGKGFASWGQIFCKSCEDVVSENYMSERILGEESSKAAFEVNTRATFAFMGIAKGFSAMNDWAAIMNLQDSLSKNAFQKTKDKIHSGSKDTCQNVIDNSVSVIKEKYADIGVLPDANNVLDISVSFDGSWQRRGHSSHNGLGVAIDLLTGLPVDFEVLSNFCHKCLEAPEKDDPLYKEWYNHHKDKCNKNYAGSSNSMEQQCAKVIWERSVEKHGLRYTTMLSDGDSKSYKYLVESKVYGDSIAIQKEECTNHVSKRMGTALNNLKSECRAQGERITGKGKLTNQMILKIQNYYGKAIKDNAEDISVMKKRIFAILYHLTSSDKDPKHMHCPPGERSWCFWQRALAKDISPGAHKDHETLPMDVGRKLVPIFKRLSEESLLERCKRNMTQNPNESLHSVIWKYCPKIVYVGRKSIESATNMAICQFSLGATFREALCKTLAIEPGSVLRAKSLEKSAKCAKKADKAASKASKLKRKRLKYSKLSKDKKVVSKEGATYKAGAFI